jgi:hypothetical protein
MCGIKTTVVAILVLATLMVGGQRADATVTPSPPPVRLYLATYGTVELSAFWAGSTRCWQTPPENGRGSVGCIHGDMAGREPPRLDQRIKAAFRGTATLTVPENTDSISIGYGRQPSIEYSTRPTVIWPIPGSGTYYLTITLKSSDEFSTSETTYYVPLWVPRTA